MKDASVGSGVVRGGGGWRPATPLALALIPKPHGLAWTCGSHSTLIHPGLRGDVHDKGGQDERAKDVLCVVKSGFFDFGDMLCTSLYGWSLRVHGVGTLIFRQ